MPCKANHNVHFMPPHLADKMTLSISDQDFEHYLRSKTLA